ncbi:PH domain-containing protein [uncultured Dysosmobacter sp.]|uniref:PH domain-containing protein n=1 Tax=uncultured Dysosmobacter sp. TaxID=2591384 RepID=UPI00262262FD|nr:PH domain-containing protein [uncultured Dysosmobacter sp.]
MKDAKLEKQKKNLMELGLMEETDTLVDFFQANYVERLIGKWGKWKQGWAYFTEERLIVITGLLEDNIVIPYQKIQTMEKCSQGVMPLGIAITYTHAETGETVTDKVSMMKREKWMAFMAERAHIAAD